MSAIKRVVVVGRDAAFWLSLLALRRALEPAGIAVEGVELPSQLVPADCYAAVPTLTGLHHQLGLDRRDVLRAADGLPTQGQRFSAWGVGPFVHGYDGPRAAINNIDILQFWIAGRINGLAMPYEELSVASVAARQGRVGNDDRDPATFGTCHRGYNLDARAYVAALAQLARTQRGVIASGSCLEVERQGDEVSAVVVDGQRIEADLFVDATGADALVTCSPFNDWKHWFPANHLFTASLPKLTPWPAFADIRAFAGGWAGLFPLRRRTAVQGACKCGPGGSDELLSSLSQLLGATPLDVIVRPFAAGTRSAWSGNVVAIGDSFTHLEPLDAMQLQLIHAGISNLIAWFPNERHAPPEAASYNAIMARYAANIRDFMIAHYRFNGRVGEPLWDAARAVTPPDTLLVKTSLFAARGLTPLNDDETFDEGSWSSSLIGHGLVPQGYDPRVDLIPLPEALEKMQRLLLRIADEVRGMPTVEGYLAE